LGFVHAVGFGGGELLFEFMHGPKVGGESEGLVCIEESHEFNFAL
jgi:hypothetical protein